MTEEKSEKPKNESSETTSEKKELSPIERQRISDELFALRGSGGIMAGEGKQLGLIGLKINGPFGQVLGQKIKRR